MHLQTRPLSLLSGDKHCFSFDLKSATDRWPLLSMFYLMQVCFGRQFASAVVNSALGTNVFEVSWVKRRSVVCFQTGQPLGYYSSWPLFALTHHAMIWWCAEQVYPQTSKSSDYFHDGGQDSKVSVDKSSCCLINPFWFGLSRGLPVKRRPFHTLTS